MHPQSRIMSQFQARKDASESEDSEWSCLEQESEDSIEEEFVIERLDDILWRDYSRRTPLNSCLPDFLLNDGPIDDFSDMTSPSGFFSLYIDDNFLLDICNFTHTYYEAFKDDKKSNTSHKKL